MDCTEIPWEGTTTPGTGSDESLPEWRTGQGPVRHSWRCLCKELSLLPKFPCHLLYFKPQTKCLPLVSNKTVRSYRPLLHGIMSRGIFGDLSHSSHSNDEEHPNAEHGNVAHVGHEEFADSPADWANRLSKTKSQHVLIVEKNKASWQHDGCNFCNLHLQTQGWILADGCDITHNYTDVTNCCLVQLSLLFCNRLMIHHFGLLRAHPHNDVTNHHIIRTL